MLRTKIVCTIGPASREPEMLRQLMLAGMNVARLNYSHGDQRFHGENIRSKGRSSGWATYSLRTSGSRLLLLAQRNPGVPNGFISSEVRHSFFLWVPRRRMATSRSDRMQAKEFLIKTSWILPGPRV